MDSPYDDSMVSKLESVVSRLTKLKRERFQMMEDMKAKVFFFFSSFVA
jgi:hypothetical protein